MERIGQKHLAGKTIEARIHLTEKHPRVAQHQAGGLHQELLAADTGTMRRGVVLHLGAGLEVVASRGKLGWLADTVATAEGSECLIGERCALGDELFVHPHQVALAQGVELENLVPVGLGFFGTSYRGYVTGITPDDTAHRTTRHTEKLRNPAHADTSCVQLQYRSTGALVQHGQAPNRCDQKGLGLFVVPHVPFAAHALGPARERDAAGHLRDDETYAGLCRRAHRARPSPIRWATVTPMTDVPLPYPLASTTLVFLATAPGHASRFA